MNFDLYAAGKVIADSSAAKEEFRKRLNRDILDVSLSMMVDLFGDIYDHIITDQQFFNKVNLSM